MPKVKLTEQQLRDIILATLNEAAPEAEASPPSTEEANTMQGFLDPFKPTAEMLRSVGYLIEANQALDRTSTDLTISPGYTYNISLREMRDQVQKSDATGNLNITWDPATAAVDSASIYKAWLKLQIIKTIQDPKKTSRKIFYVNNVVYGTQTMLASSIIIDLDRAIEPQSRVDVGTVEFFNMLDNEAFTTKISSGESVTPDAQYLDAPDPGVVFIDEESLTPLKEKADALAKQTLQSIEAVWSQFNTDFVEEYFCLPVILPNAVWMRASNTSDPRSTPWRMSYGVFNIAAQATGVRGGVAALYRKLFSYSKAGPQVQFAGRATAGDPFRSAGLFRESLEVKKALLSMTELRRVIQASLDVNLNNTNYRTSALIKEGFGDWLKRFLGLGDEMTPLQKLATKSTQSAITPAEVTAARRGLIDYLKKIGYNDAQIYELIEPDAVLPPLKDIQFPQAQRQDEAQELYELAKKIITRASNGEGINNIIIDLTRSDTFSSSIAASMPPEKRAVLLRFIRAAKERSGFLTGNNQQKAESARMGAAFIRDQFLSDFNLNPPTRTVTVTGSGGTRSTATQTLNYDAPNKTFTLESSLNPGKYLPIAEDVARKNFGDQSVDPVLEVVKGNLLTTVGGKVSIVEAIRGFQEAELARVEDAIIGILSNPTRANVKATLGLGEGDASKFDVTLEAIPTQANSISRYMDEAQGAFGKYLINPDKSIFKVLTFVERNIIGGPVRGAARKVRNILDGKGALADIADYLATNGVYSYLLGFMVYQGVNLLTPDIKSTPSRENSLFGEILATVSSALNTSILVPAVGNFVIDVLGKAFDTAFNSADENIQSLFTADALLSSEENLSTALQSFVKLTNVNPSNFPDLLRNPSAAKATTEQAAQSIAAATESGTKALTSGQAEEAEGEVAKVIQSVSAVAAIVGAGSASAGNETWINLEQSRKGVADVTIEAIRAAQSGLQGTVPDVASASGILTQEYSTVTKNEDLWLQFGTFLTKMTTGRNLSYSIEAWAWLRAKSGGAFAPGSSMTFTDYLTAQGIPINADALTIQQVNREFEKLAGIVRNQAKVPAGDGASPPNAPPEGSD